MTKTKDLLPDYVLGQMVKEYRETGDEFIFNDIKNHLDKNVTQLAYKEWHKSGSSLTDEDDFVQVAYMGLMNAINTYNSEFGSNFVAYVSQCVSWAISDEIYKKRNSKHEEFYRDSLHLDHSQGEDGYTFMDSVEHQFATTNDDVYESVLNEIDSENDLITQLTNLVKSFTEVNEADSSIVKTVISIILTEADATAKVVNTKMAAAFPEIKPATLRKRKSRAMSRFTEHAKEQGFTLDLSQF